MKLLVFGGSGQLGKEVIKRARDLNFKLYSPVSSEVDVTEKSQVEFLINKIEPDIVLNCAAYTAVDLAEDNLEIAYAVNKQGPTYMAEACKNNKSFLIHISSDYVFDGQFKDKKDQKAYTETDPVNPLGVYGKSKLAGEEAIQQILPDSSLIIRTSSLHGSLGNNFVHTMLKLFKERDEVSLVADQIMTATWTGWLSGVILDLCRIRPTGLVHASCKGELSWYEFAEEILSEARESNKIDKEVTLVKMLLSEFPAKAQRPQYSALDCKKLEDILGYKRMRWQDGLQNHLKEIK